jgi:phage terminase large subunit
MTDINISRAFRDFLGPARYKVAYGGRGSGKSWTIATLLVLAAAQRPTRILCAREFQNSIAESVHRLIADSITRHGLDSYFTVEKATIYTKTGSQFLFAGIKNNPTKIKSLEGVDICWVEEAEAVSAESWNILIPTIRKPQSEVWLSFNPRNILDETYQRFVVTPPPDCIVKKINYLQNPYFPEVLRREMEEMRARDPELAAHIWDGEPVGDTALAVIKPEWIRASVDAHIKLGIAPEGTIIAGFDVADEGGDTNSLAIRHGCILTHLTEWRDRDPNTAARHTFAECLNFNVSLCHFDNVGVGAGAKGAIREELDAVHYRRVPPRFEGFCAQASVVNPDGFYRDGKYNKDMFANLKAQAWWGLADRFKNTHDAVNGKPFDKDMLISIPATLPHVSKLCAELSQPRRDYINGKFRVEGKKDMARRGVASPNLADALVMAFAPESSFDLAYLT